jgi:hypothetical protein
LRSIIDEIRLVPQDSTLAIDLYGELGAILALTNDKAASGARSGRSTLLGAGARNQHYRMQNRAEFRSLQPDLRPLPRPAERRFENWTFRREVAGGQVCVCWAGFTALARARR